jgi:phosphoribosylformylglycinamidine synthase
MTPRVGVITFPGSLDDVDATRAVEIAGAQSISLWHADESLNNVDAVILPGGFSYGDYLRCGAISRFAPIMEKLIDAANGGLPILGICNGFQILTESHLLPGALTRNNHLHFICRDQKLKIENNTSVWTNEFSPGEEILIPLKNGEGCYIAEEKILDQLEDERRIIARYLDANPNGSRRDIAGITNEKGNVVGIMPHPEHAVEKLTGPTTDGLGFFTSVIKSLINSGRVVA